MNQSKTVRVAVFAEDAAAEEARAAGADVVGGDELIEEIRSGTWLLNLTLNVFAKIDFAILIFFYSQNFPL